MNKSELKANLLEGFRMANNIKSVAIMINVSSLLDKLDKDGSLERLAKCGEPISVLTDIVRCRYWECISDAIHAHFGKGHNVILAADVDREVVNAAIYFATCAFLKDRSINNLHELFYNANKLFTVFATWFNLCYNGKKHGVTLSLPLGKVYEMRLVVRNKYNQSFDAIEKRIEHRMKHGLRGKVNFTIEVLNKVLYGYEFRVLFDFADKDKSFDDVCSMMHYRFSDTSGKPWRNCFIMDIKENKLDSTSS